MKKFILLLFVLIHYSISAQTENGSISGVITDSQSHPLINVNVGIVGNGHGAATDENGHFILKGVTPGRHIIGVTIIGYTGQTKEVTVQPGEITSVNFQLSETKYDMPQVNILAERNGIFEMVPGAVTYINRKEIDNIMPVSGNEILRRSPGVHVVDEEGVGMRLNLGIRGLNPDR